MSVDLPKVLFCAFEVVPAPTGFSARATELLRGLESDFVVDALTAKSPDQSHIERYHGARLMRVPVGGGDLPQRGQAFQRAVRRQLESDEYQVVHFSDPFGGYALCEARAQYGFKLVFDVVSFASVDVPYTHPHLVTDPRFLSKVRRQELYCLLNADAVVASSNAAANYVKSLGIEPTKVHVIQSSADPALFPAEHLERPDRVPMRLLYLGSQATWQGLPALLNALAIANQSVDVRLSIVGQRHTSWRLQLDELVRELKLGGKVEFGNPVARDALAPVLRGTDVGVVPLSGIDRNLRQGSSMNKVAHYLAAGRPVIASELPVCREFLDESCGWFAFPDQVPDLARVIVQAARDPGGRIQKGEAARRRAEDQFRTRGAGKAIAQLYASLVDLPVQASGQRSTEDARRAAMVGEATALVALGDGPTDLFRAAERSADPGTDENRIPLEDPPTQTGAAARASLVEEAGTPILSSLSEGGLTPKTPPPEGPTPFPGRAPSDSRMPVIAGKAIEEPSKLEADLSALLEDAPPPPPKPRPSSVQAKSGAIPASTPPTIASGAPPPVADEWLGNLLYGYAPPANGRPAAPTSSTESKARPWINAPDKTTGEGKP